MKRPFLFRTGLFSIFFLFSILLTAQEEQNKTYRILNNGTVSDLSAYINALNKSNMRYHRLKNNRNTIVFESGVSVELFSASELLNNGRAINLSEYPDAFDPDRKLPVFSLGPNDFIMERITHNSKHH